MAYRNSIKVRKATLLYPLLMLSIANPAFAWKENSVINDGVYTNTGGTFAPNQDFNNATIKDGGKLGLGAGCEGNCIAGSDDSFFSRSEGALVTGNGSELAVGGTANNTTVENGGTILVGQAGFGAVVSNELRWDHFPAEITNTTIKDGGKEQVVYGGKSIGSTIETGGKQYVYLDTQGANANTSAAGTAENTKLNGGQQFVYGTGATATGTIIENGGIQWIYQQTQDPNQAGGGYAEGTIINNGKQYAYGDQVVVDNTTVYTDGTQFIYKSATANDTKINGGLQRVYNDGSTANDTVVNTGSQYVYLGGTVNNSKINNGLQQVYSGGIANDTTLSDGSWQKVQNTGSIATNNILSTGSTQQVWDSGQAINNTIKSGASQIVENSGIIQDTLVDGGYTSLYDGAISRGYLDITNQGTLAIQSSASQVSNIANATIDSQSSLKLIANTALTGSSNSFVNITNLDNNGVVSFSTAQLGNNTAINSFDPITLNIGNLTGNGTYAMHADIGNGIGDLIKVDQLGTSSNNNLFIANNGASNALATDTLTVVQTNNGGNSNQFGLINQVEQGGYLFNLRQNGNNWELYSDGTRGSGGNQSSTALAAGNFLNTSYLMNYINTQNLMQRMGDLRDTENTKDVDVWMRGFAGKLNSFSGNLGGFDMNYRGTQFGVDKLINLSAGALRVGVAAGYTDADPNYRDGSGGVRSYNFGLYGTYLTENNFYVDALLKYDHIKNNFSVTDTQQNKVSGKAKSNGYGLSIEAGKRFYLQEQNSGFYLEPQVQLSYMHQQGDTVHASNGLQIKLSDYDSTLGRVSTAVGYQIKNTANPINIYLKTGYVREFTGDNINYYLNNSKEKHSFKGNFWDNELGVSMTINKRHTVHADFSYANGNRFDKQQVNLGYRFTF